MTNWQPFIEVARSTKDPISLENYSIVVYSVTHKVVKLRALIDLKTANLMQDQSLVVIRDGFFPNKLISIDMRSSDEIFFNQNYHSLDYLSVGKTQHLIVALLYNGVGKLRVIICGGPL